MVLDPDTYNWDGKAELEAERENENPNAAKKQKQAFDAKHLATLHIYKNAKWEVHPAHLRKKIGAPGAPLLCNNTYILF